MERYLYQSISSLYLILRDFLQYPSSVGPDRYHFVPTRQTPTDIIFRGVASNADRNVIIKKPWDRYFIYQHLNLDDYKKRRNESYSACGGGGCAGLFTPTVGMLIDNHGQIYTFGMKSCYGPYNDGGDIIITANPSQTPLSNLQIDYVKRQADVLGYYFPGINVKEMKTLFGDETLREDYIRHIEESERIKELLRQCENELRTIREERDTLHGRINTAVRDFENYQSNRDNKYGDEDPGNI